MVEALRFGRYETVRLIASGGMAKVYVGRASGPAGFERLVAIKVMHEHIANDPDLGHAFLDEARLAAGIRHPNVVPTLDVAEDGAFLVMELVDGASLRDILRAKSGTLDLSVSLRIALDLLEGLHAAHEHRDRDGRKLHIVHRDISPHNVLVGADGVSRITDFGIAYAEARLTTTRAGQLKGKMPYMAPEQLRGVEIDRRVDVYAAGCVLWEMLAGQRLFSADNEAALACLVLDGAKRTPSSVNPNVPPPIDDACMQALLARDGRFQSARAFAEALEQAADEAGIPIARPRAVSTISEGLRPSLAPQRTPDSGRTTSPSVLADAATTYTSTLDVADGALSLKSLDLPLAARPVTVSSPSMAAAPAQGEITGTSASLVAPVSRRPSAGPGRVAAALVGIAIVGGGAWFALREPSNTPINPTSEPTAQAAPTPKPTARAPAATPPPASAAPITSARAKPPVVVLPRATSPKPPPVQAPARSVPAPAKSGELQPDRL